MNLEYTNRVNLYHNRYFTQEEKDEILFMYYENKMEIYDIATKLNSLPNHITWCLIRWKYKSNTVTNDNYHELHLQLFQ